MSKKDRFSNLLSVSEPTGANQKRQIIADYINTGTQDPGNAGIEDPVFTSLQETANTEIQKPIFKAMSETASTVMQEYSNTENQKPMKKKATFDMDKELHTRLKTHAALKGVPMVDILEDLIRSYLAGENA